jgi:transposase InsO family protein
MNAAELIDCSKGILPVVAVCRLLKVPRSSYYERRNRRPSRRALYDAVLEVQIRAEYQRSHKRYGSPRIYRALRKRGVCASRKRVARLMRQNRLVARPKKRFRVTTKSEHEHPLAPNLLQRNFAAEGPDQVWCGDITYVWTREGWMYLAVLIDVFSRRVVGWAMRRYLSQDLAIEALTRALELRRPGPGFIHHTDRGSQYAAKRYRKLLENVGAKQSMSRRGNCLDNAMAESFFSSLEHELLMHQTFDTRAEAVRAVAEYIENFYNRQRLHSSLDYECPVAYEERQMAAIAA